MSWLELKVTTTANLADELSEQLFAFGAQAVTFQDAADNPIFEPTPETSRIWPKTQVVSLFDVNHPMDAIYEFLRANQLVFEINPLGDEDWERRCLEGFKPLKFGKRLWVCPSWIEPPEHDGVNLILDPGLAFGTGTHPTTQLCLEWLDRHIHGGETIIDFGCGSGILAIAALKLGASKAFGVDIDPQALETTRENATRNHIDSTGLILTTPGELPREVDIVVANILSQPLIELTTFLASHIKTGGKIVLSGILKDQTMDVLKTYNNYFQMDDPVYMDDWVRLTGIRNNLKLTN